VILVTKAGMVNRTPADQIRQCGRNTKGVRLINLKSEDQLVSVAVVQRDASPEEDTEAPTTPNTPEAPATEA